MRIWPLGDSITVGASAPQHAPGGYRTGLDQLLGEAGVAHHFVGTWSANSSPTLDLQDQARHDGHGGYRVDQVRRDLDGLAYGPTDLGGRWLTRPGAANAINPDVVLVHLGTNDILQDWDTRRFPTRTRHADLASPAQRATFVADLTARLSDLLLSVHTLRPHAEIVVATIVPIDVPVFAETTADYAAAVRVLVTRVRSRGVPAVLADAYAAFVRGAPPGDRVAPGLLCQDAVHPSAAGYAVLARTFASVLEGLTLPMSASTGERP
jgi:lysophospholipase L1-like esterase